MIVVSRPRTPEWVEGRDRLVVQAHLVDKGCIDLGVYGRGDIRPVLADLQREGIWEKRDGGTEFWYPPHQIFYVTMEPQRKP